MPTSIRERHATHNKTRDAGADHSNNDDDDDDDTQASASVNVPKTLAAGSKPNWLYLLNLLILVSLIHQYLSPILFPSPSTTSSLSTSSQRQSQIRQAFQDSYNAYSEHAMGADELQPNTQTPHTWLNLSLTLFDSLDTSLILNLPKTFDQILTHLHQNFHMDSDVNANVFETTIRVLGGTLSAHHLSQSPSNKSKLKELAIRIGQKLLSAFEPNTLLPLTSIHLKTNQPVRDASFDISTAEVTSIQLEFKYLSHVTGDAVYWNKVERIMDHVYRLSKFDGLVTTRMSSLLSVFRGDQVSLGSNGDSYYEYLGKQYLLTNRTQEPHLREYKAAISGIKKHLLRRSYPSRLLYIQEITLDPTRTRIATQSSKMDHLACFLPGTMALMATQGKKVVAEERTKRLGLEEQEDLHVAEELMRTCYEMYRQTTTGLGAEVVHFREGDGKGLDVEAWLKEFRERAREAKEKGEPFIPKSLVEERSMKDGEKKTEIDFVVKQWEAQNILRPEVVESLFVLYRCTGDEKYREWGWKIFEGFEKYSKVAMGGYSSISNVMEESPRQWDKMESFFMGETLKYLYLLFEDDEFEEENGLREGGEGAEEKDDREYHEEGHEGREGAEGDGYHVRRTPKIDLQRNPAVAEVEVELTTGIIGLHPHRIAID
ncbi:mannosyl-oligosaccharide alpha-1,2-mannosidase [Phlyctochytrium planicorne]|nr:mannosyl-oligosaccharide alpha-1,2-mannosidase [Phlyctochytrium planicorne]